MSPLSMVTRLLRAIPATILGRREHLEEQRLNRQAIERARVTVDRWNERTQANWRADGARPG